MMHLIAFSLAWTGFAALALAMDRHHRQACAATPAGWLRWLLRGIGMLGLTTSLATCVVSAGWGTGFVLWFGLLGAALIVVVLVLTYRPKLFAMKLFLSMPSQPGTDSTRRP